MAFTAGVTRATGDTVTATIWNNYMGASGSIDYLNSTPGSLTYADYTTAAAPAAPGAAKGRFYVVTGDRPGFRSGAAGAAEVLESQANKAAASGYASLDAGVLVPSAQIPVITDAQHGERTTANAHAIYILHSLATALNDVLMASGAGVFVKQTLAQLKTALAIAADIATHAAIATAHHSNANDHAASHTHVSHTGIGATDHHSNVVGLAFIIDGGGAAITTGQKGHLEVPFAMTITGWTILADQSGSIVVDIWKDTYANFPPTVADTIAGTEKPTLASVQKNQDLTLTTWATLAIAAGDILAFNVDSITTVQRVVVVIRGTKT